MLRVMMVDLWRRTALLQVALASLATLAPLRLAMAVGGIDGAQSGGARALLTTTNSYAPLMTGLACLIGLLLGTGVWQADHSSGHVYALTLPLPRWHYALLRYSGGLLVLVALVFAFWIGTLAAASLVTLPYGLHAYPTALAVRFALTALLAFSVFFSLSALTTRTAAIILLSIVAIVIFEIALNSMGAGWSLFEVLVLERGDWLLTPGRWMLFDV